MTNIHPRERTIQELCIESHATAIAKGWWEGAAFDRPILEQIALMHSELSEAVEEIRDGHAPDETYYNQARTVETPDGGTLAKPEGFLAELADLFIRVGDTVGRYNLTAEFALVLEEKLRYNKYRPFRHGNKTA